MKLDDAAVALSHGGVLLLSTDTLPGIHCRADDQDAVMRVACIKGRDSNKPLLVLAGSLEQALKVCGPLSALQLKYCRSCWPGPFSLILPAGERLAERVSCGLGTVAIRVPAEENLRCLISTLGMPLVSTSANLQNEEPMRDLKEAWESFKSKVDGVWTGDPDLPSVPIASALVDLCIEPPKILRSGPLEFPWAD